MRERLSPDQFAASLSAAVTGRQVRNLCEAGMAGAKRIGARWKIDPTKARVWISDPNNAPKIAARIPIDVTAIVDRPSTDLTVKTSDAPIDQGSAATPVPAMVPGNSAPRGMASILEKHVADMDMVASVLLKLLASGRYEPRAATMVKQTLSEIRMAEQHVLEMRQADARLMDRDRHRLICSSIAALLRQEVESQATRYPEPLMAALTKSGLQVGRVDSQGTFRDDPSAALRVLQASLMDMTAEALNRLADDFERTDIEAKADSEQRNAR